MDYLYECLTENMPKAGSLHYYAYRRCDNETTRILYTLDQLKFQWLKASELYHEPYPSLQKLQWWQQTLTNPEAHRNHPLIDKLCEYFTVDELIKPLQQDLEYAITTIAEGRNYQNNLDLSQSFLGIAILKSKILGFENAHQIKALNGIDELLRHVLFMGKHFSRNIVLDKALKPNMDTQTFKQISQKLLTHMTTLKKELKLDHKQIKQIKPLILLHKQQVLCVRKFIQKVDNPFKESIRVSPLLLLSSTFFASKL